MTLDPTLGLLLACGLVVGALVAAVQAYRGRLSWRWVWLLVGLAGGALVARRRPGVPVQPRRPPPPPVPPSAAEAVAPVVEHVELRAQDELQRISDAEQDPDRLERLERLANLNDGGRR